MPLRELEYSLLPRGNQYSVDRKEGKEEEEREREKEED